MKEEEYHIQTPLKDTDLSKSTINILERNRINCIRDLLNYPPDDDITFIDGIGKKRIAEITEMLKTKGIDWKKRSYQWRNV